MYLLKRLLLVCILPLALLTSACGNSDNGNPTAPSTPAPQGPAELQKIDLTVGTGAEAAENKVVIVAYRLWRYDPQGTDSKGEGLSEGTTNAFRIGTNAYIQGFEQGVIGMKVDGIRRIIVPPNLAYGASGRDVIRPNEWLVFELALLQVQ